MFITLFSTRVLSVNDDDVSRTSLSRLTSQGMSKSITSQKLSFFQEESFIFLKKFWERSRRRQKYITPPPSKENTA